MVTLVCWNCGQEIDVKFLEDITDCPKCGEKMSRSYVPKGTCRKSENEK